MTKLKYYLLVYILLILSIFQSRLLYSSHYAGADMTWQCVGQDSFIITLTLYRDCQGYDFGNANISFKCKSTGSTIISKNISKPVPIDITPVCNGSCTRCTSSTCSFPYGIQKFVYNTGIMVLSSAGSCCTILMIYQTCCRSQSISTGPSGNFYCEAVLNRCITPCDNSPVFKKDPLTIVCVGDIVTLDFSCIDTDKDSNGIQSDSLVFLHSPPYGYNATPINYLPPFSYDKPLIYNGFPYNNYPIPKGFHLNEEGLLTFQPTQTCITVISIRVKEYRNGILIGQIMRDMQLLVMNCPVVHPPIIYAPPSPILVCPGDTVAFNISTFNYFQSDTVTISAFHSIPNATWLDNNGLTKFPQAIFTWAPGIPDTSRTPYKLFVRAVDQGCPLNSFTIKEIDIYVKPLRPEVSISYVDSGCNHYYFSAEPLYVVDPTYIWKGLEDSIYDKQSFYHSFIKRGQYPFSLTVVDTQACIDDTSIYTGSVYGNTYLEVELPGDTFICEGSFFSIQGKHKNANGNYSYHWNTGHNTENITIGPLFEDTTIILFVTDNSLCWDSDTMFAKIKHLDISIGDDQIICDKEQADFVADYDLETGDSLTAISWYRLGNTNSLGTNDTLSAYEEGTYICVIENNRGCTRSDSAELTLIKLPEINISQIPIQCIDGFTIRLNNYVYPKGGQWSCPGSGLIQPDVIDPQTAGIGNFWAYYSFTDPITACTNVDSVKIIIVELPDTVILIRGDTLIAVADMLYYDWFKDGNPINHDSNFLLAEESGNYYVMITDSNGCKNTSSTHYVFVKPDIVAEYHSKEILKVFPNPNNGKFTITINKSFSDNLQIKLFNLLGVEIETIPLFKGITDFEVDFRNYPKGIYFIEFIDGFDLKYFKKIILN